MSSYRISTSLPRVPYKPNTFSLSPQNLQFTNTPSGNSLSRPRTTLAVNKPKGISSAQVIRDVQQHFNPSKLFQPWLEEERAKIGRDPNRQRNKFRKKKLHVKIGHGGTLDPLATGVLIAGVGKGTKELQGFLGCTKTYETVVLFGAETDTYDRVGKVVRKTPYEHITREAVEKALEKFRGNIMQRPPIFSALRIQGKRLYDYAREGIEPPVEIAKRPVEVSNLEIVEWYNGGEHEHIWPEEELAGEEKAIAEKLLAKDASPPPESEASKTGEGEQPVTKRKPSTSPPPAETSTSTAAAPPSPKRQKTETETETETQTEPTNPVPDPTTSSTSQPTPPSPNKPKPNPPAVKLTITSSSGFYVRSLCHDLGKALNSSALMSELIRSRQADFELGPDKVLEYADLEAGEEVWGPKVQGFLERWAAREEKGEEDKKEVEG